jgi:putative spermidine/putrescine transport system substrate-binding protein
MVASSEGNSAETTTIAVAAAALSGALLAAGCGGGTNSSGGSTGGTDWSKATSVAQGGGMNALIAAAKKEGQLNVDANPDGSSQDEINAMVQLKGQTRAPDVLDMRTAFAIKADQMKLLAKYASGQGPAGRAAHHDRQRHG